MISLIILLKPNTSNLKFSKFTAEGHQIYRRSIPSFEYKLTSFYAYLTALSFCDFFSCIFAILNVLEYIQPPYIETNSIKFREFCISVSVYTYPIAITLQALSAWIICAFSIHRCRSIVKPSSFLSSFLNQKTKEIPKSNETSKTSMEKNTLNKRAQDSSLFTKIKYRVKTCFIKNQTKPNYFCQIQLKNNCTHKNYEIKFYSRSFFYFFGLKKKFKICSYCFCAFKPEFISKSSTSISEINNLLNKNVAVTLEPEMNSVFAITSVTTNNSMADSNHKTSGDPNHKTHMKKINKTRLTICFLYLLAILYLIPLMFEKEMSQIEIENQTYIFTQFTSFGRSKLFRQLFHLWLYLFAVFIIPFFLIFFFNLILLRAFLVSKRKCKQYKFKKDPTNILKDYSSVASTINNDEISKAATVKSHTLKVINSSPNILEIKDNVSKSVICPDGPSTLSIQKNDFPRKYSIKNGAVRVSQRNRALTFTLFGVAVVFGVCQLPAAIARIFFVLYPEFEFVNSKNPLISLWSDVANFLVMLNSSVNFLLYIVFGPGKFREEFTIIFFSIFSCCAKRSNKMNSANTRLNSISVNYSNNKKFSVVSENQLSSNNNMTYGKRLDSIVSESYDPIKDTVAEEHNV